jgi:hypothetical protein
VATLSYPAGDVRISYAVYPAEVRTALLNLRSLILATANNTPGVGDLVETLKWGQPAFLPARPRTGTTIPIDAVKGSPRNFAVYFHCQTTLVATFRELYGDLLTFEGNRAIVLSLDEDLPRDALCHCIALALTYHRPGATAVRSIPHQN